MTIFARLGAIVALVMTMMVTLAPPAHALATAFSSPGINSPTLPGQTLLCDFDTTCADKLSGNFGIVQGTTANWAAPQLLNTTKYVAVPGTGSGGEALLDLSWAGPMKSLSFQWGSIDTYNSIEVLLASASPFTLTGSNVISTGFGDQSSANANRMFYILFDDWQTVNGLRFKSTQRAFEFDRFSAELKSAGAVPEPSAWAMLIAGFGLVGFAARRRRAANDNGFRAVAA